MQQNSHDGLNMKSLFETYHSQRMRKVKQEFFMEIPAEGLKKQIFFAEA